ncbi:MAG: glycoside hydrolase family 5 protein [Microthrixaceae bacterium]|nr:cellulase family glycosylhydrolase [Microthrixaceae bacterium]MCO5314365.1 glycoside hydrolase family 5 protein [Microthrixaceae bacterium]
MRRGATPTTLVRTAAVVLVAVLSASCSDSDGADEAAGGASTTNSASVTTVPVDGDLVGAGGPLELLPLQTAGTRIVDTAGRDVLLRGANLNSLGEYWQGVPEVDATVEVTADDWDLMAANGFSVVRLIVSWSRIEPERGEFDDAYLDEVEAAVDEAAARGIYTVVDMHQDAFTASLWTEDPSTCPEGTVPAKGWDGAPGWAVTTDGLSTCLRNGDRNSSPAVEAAWNHFYDNTDGTRDHFVAAWAAVAERFAGNAAVAGYDLLNEPEVSRPAAELQPVYDEFMAQTIESIRTAEREAGAPFEHIVFVEPAIPAGDLSRGIVVPTEATFAGGTTNAAVSVHNYMESINHIISLESLNESTQAMADALGVASWGGEYGFWDVEPDTLAVGRRYAADEDAHRWGGAWWQWRQSCGDPHSVQWENGAVVADAETEVHLNLLGCPGNEPLGPNEEFLSIVGRSFPRAAPGTIVELRSDIDGGALLVRGRTATPGATLVVWHRDGGAVQIDTEGLGEVTEHRVDGGRYLTAEVTAADYRFELVGRGA